jgi:predicted transcriptional regulator
MNQVGEYLRKQREIAGVTRTAVAERMMYPGGAIKAIEECRRVPKPATVMKYLSAVMALSGQPFTYNRFHNQNA